MWKGHELQADRVVALRKESVDRNFIVRATSRNDCQSLSARRAWIEMLTQRCMMYKVASLSARRAWIEIPHPKKDFHSRIVALRKESVDRNTGILAHHARKIGRSPQGERG